MSEFKFNAPSYLVRLNLEAAFSKKFRSFKYMLRQNYFKIAKGKSQIEAAIQAGLDPNACKTKEQILVEVPMGITPSNWTNFVENEFKEGVREIHEKKSENKKQYTIPHTLGRRTCASKFYLLAEEEGMLTEDREYAWMKGHEKCNGIVHPLAVEKYEQFKAAYEKRKWKGTNCSYDFGSDGLVDVFGPDKGKRSLRGFSSSVSAKRAKQAFLTASLCDPTVMAQEISSDHPTNEQTNDSCTPNSDFTPEFTPYFTPENHSFTKNLNPMSEPQPVDNFGYEESSDQNVNLLDMNGNIVAAGYVVTGLEGEFCHHRIVQKNKSKVRIEYLCSYVCGGWVVWHKKRLQFTN
ncbi:hypothetical protein MKX03_021509 [Papaver bracteatum]|nr:hypothetical protein MKX03_021509 [Papaver bracteatum]